MKTLELKSGFYYTGILDPDLRLFDIIMHTEFGTSYNSYLLKSGGRTVLFETAKAKFQDEYFDSIKQLTNIEDIDYVVVDHTEPDHVGSLEALLDMNPEIQVIGTLAAINFLKNIVNKDFKSIVAKQGSTITVGEKTLEFIMAPNLHWPDTMYTYIKEDKTLITCDSFGSHYAHNDILRSTVTDTEGYMRATKYYFDNILGPFKNPYMTNALAKVDELDIDMICPGHGPVLDSHINELKNIYREWCKVPECDSKSVVIAYVSAYGYTKQLANSIADGIKSFGIDNIKMLDITEVTVDDAVTEILNCDGFLLGSPTILSDALKPIQDIASTLCPPLVSGKHASAFGSYGWSGEAVPNLMARLKQLKLKVEDEGFRVKFKPSETELNDAFDFGKNFASTI